MNLTIPSAPLMRLFRPSSLILGLCVLLLATAWPAAVSGQGRVRKNIDDLSEQELDNYIHAVNALKKKAEADPNSKDGFLYYASLHDSLKIGPCEHGQDTFLPWHRALLWMFEEALRRSDPPTTSNVTIPYWDWSRPPSGVRFPKIVEAKLYKGVQNPLNNMRPLFSVTREKGKICPQVCPPGQTPPPGCSCLPWPRWWLEQNVLNNSRWEGVGNFAGQNFPDRDCNAFSRSTYGTLERDPHNTIHDSYVGGNMADPSSAGEDPLFWSFHTYIDLLFAQWQERGNKVDSCLQCEFCGLFKQSNPTPVRYKVEDVLDIKQMGYSYEYKPQTPDVLLSQKAVAQARYFEPHPAVDFALSGEKPAEITKSENVTVPQPGIGEVKLRLSGVKINTSFSYQGNVYLYPANTPFKPLSRAFRSRYLVDVFTIWKTHTDASGEGHAAHEQSTDIGLDLTDEMKGLATSQAGKHWVVTVVLVTDNSRVPRRAGARLLSNRKSLAEALNFEGIKIEITRP
jgi:tyrosinase